MRKLTILILLLPLLCVGQKPLVHGKNVLSYGGTVLSCATPSSSFSPTDLDSLKLWLKADAGVTKDGSDNVTGWADQSGYGNDASVAVVAPTWVNAVLNGKPIIRFTGASSTALQVADDASIDFVAGFTMFVVLRQTTLSATQTILAKWDYGIESGWGFQADYIDNTELQFYVADNIADPGSNNIETTDANLTNSQFYDIAVKYNPGSIKVYRDGTLLNKTTTGTIPATLVNNSITLKIGNWGGALYRYFTGDIAEIIIYSRALPDGELGQVDLYLKNKWGL